MVSVMAGTERAMLSPVTMIFLVGVVFLRNFLLWLPNLNQSHLIHQQGKNNEIYIF
jgi:hypothetical protein